MVTGAMSELKVSGSRGAALVLIVAGVAILLLSFQTWGSCPTTPCGGILMAISEYSGIALGFGVVTALAGLTLTLVGLRSLRGSDVAPYATAAVLLSLLIVGTASASVIWMYLIPGDDKEFYWPPFTAILVGVVGAIALVASLWLRRSVSRRE